MSIQQPIVLSASGLMHSAGGAMATWRSCAPFTASSSRVSPQGSINFHLNSWGLAAPLLHVCDNSDSCKPGTWTKAVQI
jgi:hypothetical protein